MPPNSDDKWYEKNGVAPPSREAHGTQEDIANALKEKMRHDWRQDGSRLYCIACPFTHSTEPRFTNFLLQGTDKDGKPILKKLGS